MARIRKQRDIIDRKALTAELEALASWSGYGPRTRPKVLQMFKDALAAGQGEIRRRFEHERARGMEVVAANAFLIDQLVRTIHDFAERFVYPVANPTTGEQISIVAVGGYGRRTLAPHSDIDLMFLLPYKQTAHVEQVVEFMLYLLWDMGLKVGHSTRSVDDCMRLARQDLTIRTALLDARWLWGNQELFTAFRRRFVTDLAARTGPEFVEAKLAERDDRHERMGDTRYVLEPNIKEGKGGLRDLQTLFWIATYLYQVDTVRELVDRGVLTRADARRFAKAENFLWTVRCHLHYLTDRPEERLTFDVQTTIGERMGYTDRAGVRGVERFMKHYFLVAKDVGDLTRVLCAVLEEQHKKRKGRLFSLPNLFKRTVDGFELDAGRINFADPAVLSGDPVNILRLFHEAQRLKVDVHPAALRLVSQNLNLITAQVRNNPEANRLFTEMLIGPEPGNTLLRLNEAGVFGRFIPDFGRVVAQMQYDMYHVYTVDEHTIRAIEILSGIEAGRYLEDMPVSSGVVHELVSRRALYAAVLMHDIAKGRGGDHSVLGAGVAERLGPRLGLSEEETETVAWLVRHHLLMSRTAFKRDIDDAKTISDFVEVVQSPERLKLLLLLTVSDIRAVGPGVWNNWKAGLLRGLYLRAMERLSDRFTTEMRDVRVERARDAVRQGLAHWPAEDVEEHLARGYASYWLTFDTETHLRHAELVRQAEAEGLPVLIATRPDPDHDVTEVIIYTADHPGIFSRMAGAMALAGASIVDARIVTLANGMALDTFSVQDRLGEPFAEPAQIERLKEWVVKALTGAIHPGRELEKAKRSALPSRTGVFTVAPRVLVDNHASRTHTVVEVNGRDRLGFLHDVTAALAGLGLQISAARISTYGERAVDVFYVKDVFGLKVESEEKLRVIRTRMQDAVAEKAAGSQAPRDKAAE